MHDNMRQFVTQTGVKLIAVTTTVKHFFHIFCEIQTFPTTKFIVFVKVSHSNYQHKF